MMVIMVLKLISMMKTKIINDDHYDYDKGDKVIMMVMMLVMMIVMMMIL